MNWIDIRKQLPEAMPEWYENTHDCSGNVSVLVYGFDVANYYPRYEVMHVNDVASAKPRPDGNYVFNELMVTRWMKIERPL